MCKSKYTRISDVLLTLDSDISHQTLSLEQVWSSWSCSACIRCEALRSYWCKHSERVVVQTEPRELLTQEQRQDAWWGFWTGMLCEVQQELLNVKPTTGYEILSPTHKRPESTLSSAMWAYEPVPCDLWVWLPNMTSDLSTGSLRMAMKRAFGWRAWMKSWMRKGGSASEMLP